MITEMSDVHSQLRLGWILYDGECELCRRSVEFWRGVFERRGFGFAPLQTEWVRQQLQMNDAALLREMRVLLPDGRVFGGADAILRLARQVWWTRPLAAASWIPGVKRLLRAGYRKIAARRNCLAGACSITTQRTTQDARVAK